MAVDDTESDNTEEVSDCEGGYPTTVESPQEQVDDNCHAQQIAKSVNQVFREASVIFIDS